MILDLDHVPVGGRQGKPEDRPGIDPWVARHDAVGLAGRMVMERDILKKAEAAVA